MRFRSGFFKASLLLTRDSGVQEGQTKYTLQSTGTRAGLLEVNTLRKMGKGQNTPDLNNGLLSCMQMRHQGWTPFFKETYK